MSIIPLRPPFKGSDHNCDNSQFIFPYDIIKIRKITKNVSLTLLIISLSSCTVSSVKQSEDKCAGINELPVEYAAEFQEVVDEPMLKRAIGNIDEGGLCQGKVYLSKNNMALPIYRLWNSANPNSRLDKWWAFKLPVGKISTDT